MIPVDKFGNLLAPARSGKGAIKRIHAASSKTRRAERARAERRARVLLTRAW